MEHCCTCKEGTPLCARNIRIFSSLSEKELYKIVELVKHKRYSKGEFICREGDVFKKLFLIREGKVKISKITKEGKEQIVHILSKGDFFGENTLFMEESISALSAQLITEGKICILKKESLDQILKDNPEISLKIIKDMAERIKETEDLAQNLATKDIEARIAYMLLEFSDKFGNRIGENIYVELPLNREDMANYCGITRETMSRKLSKMNDEGLIDTDGNKGIIIKNIEELESMI